MEDSIGGEKIMYHVMIVEDEKFVRIGLKKMIHWESLNMEVIIDVKNGEEAYKYYLQYKPDIILTDLRMPLMSGIELIKKIREQDKHTKFIIITCLDDFGLVQEALELGVSSYILKHSSDIEEIENKLKKVYNELNSAKKMHELYIGKINNTKYSHPKLIVAMDYIYKNFNKNITLQSTADYIGVTPNYLGRLFVAHNKETFTETLNYVRIEKARELLNDLKLPVYIVAEHVGFSNATYFIRVFKRMVGCTPNEYRMRRMSDE